MPQASNSLWYPKFRSQSEILEALEGVDEISLGREKLVHGSLLQLEIRANSPLITHVILKERQRTEPVGSPF